MDIEAHLQSIDRRQAQIVELLRKLTSGVLALNRRAAAVPRQDDPLDEYDFVYIQSNGVGRWVWKHFLRGARSTQTFESREAAVRDAERDVALQIRNRGLLTRT